MTRMRSGVRFPLRPLMGDPARPPAAATADPSPLGTCAILGRNVPPAGFSSSTRGSAPIFRSVGDALTIGPEFEGVLAAAQAGAEWAFDVLYRELNPRLLRYFRSQAPAAAEDLASETWIGAARNLSGFAGGEEEFRAWLFKIGYRRLVQHWRDRGRDRSTPVDPYAIPEAAAPLSTEEAVLDADFLSGAAQRIVEELTADQAQVVMLRVLGGLSVAQVAEVLGKRPGTVRVVQHKALKRLAGRNFWLEEVTQ